MLREAVRRRANPWEPRIAASRPLNTSRVTTRTACGSRVVVEGLDATSFARLRRWSRRRGVSLALIVGDSTILLPKGATGSGPARTVAVFVPVGGLSREQERRVWQLLGRSGVRIPLVRGLRGRTFSDEGALLEALADVVADGRGDSAPSREHWEAARTLYVPINVSRRWLGLADLAGAALSCAVFTASFSLGLGFHPVVPCVGFACGLFGRYLARLRAAVAFDLGDGVVGNSAALALDAVHGMLLMGLVINPAAGLGFGAAKIIWTSACHTLSRGALRLSLDKRFSAGSEERQSLGVLTTIGVDFAIGLLTSLAYAGGTIALALQSLLAAIGLFLLAVGPRGDGARRLRFERRAVMV